MRKSSRPRVTLLVTSLLLVGGSVATVPAFAQGNGHGHGRGHGHAPSAPEARDFPAEILEAQKAAKTAAKFEHLGTLNRLCFLPPVNGASAKPDVTPEYIDDPSKAPDKSTWYAEPAQVFDNLYFVGGSVHSAWILKTSNGLILIDAGYQYSAQTLILDGMKKLGLDPKDIKRIIISHAHGDHVGGVQVVQKATKNARVVMGAADWKSMLAKPKTFKGQMPNARNLIKVKKDRDITVGDTTVHVATTPGHTPGTLSYTFKVTDHGTPMTVAYVGGTAFGFQNSTPDPGIANYQEYIDSAAKMKKLAHDAGATVLLSNHSEFDEAVAKTKQIPGRGFGPNPFVNGADSVDRYFDVTLNCAKAAQLGLEQVAAGQ